MLRHRREALDALCGELQHADRLVLLGDVLELRHGPVRDALKDARPVLSALGEALGSDRELVLVPGNHDHHLLDAWLERRARNAPPPPLGLDTELDWRAGEPLAALARAVAPARMSVRYPGVWLREDIFATHGHYGDRHTTVPMLERLAAGVMIRLVDDPPGGARAAEDYEAVLGPIYAWIHAVAQHGGPPGPRGAHGPSARAWRTLAGSASAAGAGSRGRRLRRRGLQVAFPAVVRAMNRAGLGPLEPDLSGTALRRAPLQAIDVAMGRLGVNVPYVVFGHSHRAGPLPGDDPEEWRFGPGRRGHLTNSGCWVQERAFLGPDPARSPYRAGFAVVIEDEGAPGLKPLLDRLR